MSGRNEERAADRFGPLHLGQLLVLIGIGLLGGLALIVEPPERSVPDFDLDGPVEIRKQAFFDYLAPRIIDANAEVHSQRKRLLAIERDLDGGGTLGWRDRRWLRRLAQDYEVPEEDAGSAPEVIQALKLRVDIVPPGLALVQAAIESGWGRSRFAREANNLFGHWCYESGCGLVPDRREEGARHEVAAFDSAHQAVVRYLHNLNTHPPYEAFRVLRAEARAADRRPDAAILAEGLQQYSERRAAYVEDVQAALRANRALIEDAVARVPRAWLDA
jgi:Bax protein